MPLDKPGFRVAVLPVLSVVLAIPATAGGAASSESKPAARAPARRYFSLRMSVQRADRAQPQPFSEMESWQVDRRRRDVIHVWPESALQARGFFLIAIGIPTSGAPPQREGIQIANLGSRQCESQGIRIALPEYTTPALVLLYDNELDRRLGGAVAACDGLERHPKARKLAREIERDYLTLLATELPSAPSLADVSKKTEQILSQLERSRSMAQIGAAVPFLAAWNVLFDFLRRFDESMAYLPMYAVADPADPHRIELSYLPPGGKRTLKTTRLVFLPPEKTNAASAIAVNKGV